MRKSDYSVVNYIQNAKMKRLVLFESYYGFQLDLVNIYDQSYKRKDYIINKIVEWDDLVLKSIYRLKKWRKQYEFVMVSSKGYPNNFILQIILFYIMMKLQLVPWLNENDEFDLSNFTKNTGLTVNYIVNSFMRFISKIENKEVVDLRARRPYWGQAAWEILDPSNNSQFKCMTQDVPQWVCFCAQNYLRFKSFDESYQQINRTLFCTDANIYQPKQDIPINYQEKFDIRDCMLDYLEVANNIPNGSNVKKDKEDQHDHSEEGYSYNSDKNSNHSTDDCPKNLNDEYGLELTQQNYTKYNKYDFNQSNMHDYNEISQSNYIYCKEFKANVY
eukprot:Mrub_03815.p1 GENE.Mrub_03815~~Mrub_03815.p1  ORF type:complete len:331 (+),score=84.94 Mrub_03815:285-1277(+)